MPERRQLVAGLLVLAVAGTVILLGPLAWMFDEERAAAARSVATAALAAGDAEGAQEALAVAESALQAAHGEEVGGPAALELARLRARSPGRRCGSTGCLAA